MPTYEYYCESNDQTVEAMHSMGETLSTWGELCAYAGIDPATTPEDSVVRKKLSTISLLKKKVSAMVGGGRGCCGGGCGCGGH
tara:strand:+ start:399 stop:647 length:249 start_codon:yes stop_codon:yes gene_type:complete